MGFLGRLRTLFIKGEQPGLAVDAPDLVVVAECFDDTEAASAALTRSSDFIPPESAVLRHHLSLPATALAEAAALVAQDGYVLREVGADQAGRTVVTAARAQVVTALECARERSRMASMATRLGGDALGWDVLQPR
ncbi:hypothetical protein [Actinokineospora globicatena]|uniref:Uncharacterized protein n=1 Tax=Actinokineospora globicatena TaxID=103729 RepID=A0A9W6QJI3_9PSEU|nr:hypothetical protein [Actinokineospora globicatena]GLW91598.1 hypothetical protein Aglo03_24140 [Actinokineospora globicatena]